MTTVGYGDITPVTDSGRVIAVVVMVVGIGFLTMLIGATAERFVTPDVEAVTEAEESIAEAEADVLREVREITERLQRVGCITRSRCQSRDPVAGRVCATRGRRHPARSSRHT